MSGLLNIRHTDTILGLYLELLDTGDDDCLISTKV